MPASETALYVGGGLLAAEALGVTNFSGAVGGGGNGRGDSGGGGMPAGISAMLGNLQGQLSALGSQGAGGQTTIIPLPGGATQPESPVDIAGLWETMLRSQGNLNIPSVPEVPENPFDGINWPEIPPAITDPKFPELPRVPTVPNVPGGGDRPTGVARTPTFLETALEAARGAGEATGATIETTARAGNTFSQVGRALSGKQYNTAGTFEETISGSGETRRLYQGNLLPSFGGGQKKEGKGGPTGGDTRAAKTKKKGGFDPVKGIPIVGPATTGYDLVTGNL